MRLKKKVELLQGKELEKRAEELGVSVDGLYDEKFFLNEPTLQRRVLEAERAARERRLWIIALIASIASVVSAIAAWMAVLKN